MPMPVPPTMIFTTLTLLTIWSMHAYGLPWTISLPILASLARAIFLLDHAETHRENSQMQQATTGMGKYEHIIKTNKTTHITTITY